MAIWFITGVPGSGKTLYTLQNYVIPSLRKGRTVYHNIEGLDERRLWISTFFDDIDPIHVSQNLIKIPDNEIKTFYDYIASQPREKAANALVIIDEVQNIYSARDYQSKENKQVISYLTTHRHFGHDVVFITQHQDNVDVAVRRMTDQSKLIDNNKNFFSKNSCTVKTYNRDQIDPRLPAPHSTVSRYDKRVYCIYKSYQGDDVKEKKVAINWWASPKLLFFEAIVVISVIFFVKGQLTGPGFLHSGRGERPKSVIRTIDTNQIKQEKKDTIEKDEEISCSNAQRVISGAVSGEVESFVNGRWVSGSFPSCR